ncbi:MAG: HIT domain-containing protein [Clostridia bacterium]
MKDCIFCKIINNEIFSKRVYEDENIIIINDANPIASKHYLLIPKRHYSQIFEQNESDSKIFSDAVKKIAELKNELGLENGYRLVINQGDDAGQTVGHLHIHILGGEKLGWSK